MKKRRLLFGLAAALIFASSLTAQAEDRKGASGWQVAFDGKKMKSNFNSSKINDEVIALQPGDSVELTIKLKNNYKSEVDWYMKNEVLETLEDAGEASGGAYDYLLTYTDKDKKTTTLYSSEKFGGDGRINGEGLRGATKTLDNYFYLDRMKKSDTGVVKLKVALDGETLVNDYQNTIARLQMDFATELAGNGTGNGGNGSGNRREVIKTGDQTQMMLFVLLTLGAGLVFLLAVLMRLRRDPEEEETYKGSVSAAVSGAQAGRRRLR